MELEGQQEPQEGQEPQQPTQPPIDPIQLAAQHLGVDPNVLVDSIRLQEENRRVYEENRRASRQLEIDRAKLEAVQQATRRYEPPPSYDDVDPVSRRILERLDKADERWNSWESQQREERERQIRVQEQGALLKSEYDNLMRTVPTQSRMDVQDFFDRMADLYPGGVPEGLSAGQAVNNTARYLGIQSNGVAPQTGYVQPRQNPYRDPRAQIVIPGGGMTTMTPSQNMADDGPQRPGESLEAYSQRLARVLEERGVRGLRDGARVSSG